MKKITLFLALACTVTTGTQAHAQSSIDRQVAGAAGQMLTSASGASLIFTIGETAIQELAAGGTLAQGFHQVQVEKSTTLSTHVAARPTIQVEVYPNPVSDLLHIQSEAPLMATLLDLQGKVVVPASAISPAVTIEVKRLSPGTYILRTHLQNGAPAETFRIQVIH